MFKKFKNYRYDIIVLSISYGILCKKAKDLWVIYNDLV
jgi:hypothetical protein